MWFLNCSRVLRLSTFVILLLATAAGNFFEDVDINFGGPRAEILNGGQVITLSMDQSSGSGFQSKIAYLFGKINMQIQLVPGNSAGTVTAFYLSAPSGPSHDEIDFEFLGNASGQPYTVQTNVFAQGVGGREQQFRLWFDPTSAFHSYTILWNPLNIIFMVDNIPIRVFKNNEANGVPYLKNQPMRVYASLWDGDDWATQGGRVKTDWTKGPFKASYRNYNAKGCIVGPSGNSCHGVVNNVPWQTHVLDANGTNWIRWARRGYMIYDYCTNVKGYPQGPPKECTIPMF